jgi:hypothetical protein
MKTPLAIVIAMVVPMADSALAIMNNACKSRHYEWCAPISTARHHVKAEQFQGLLNHLVRY